MVVKILCFFALFCAASCNPLGQSTICETAPNHYPGMIPNIGSTTVCESASNLHPFGLGMMESGLMGLGYPYGFGVPPTTTIMSETVPGVLGFGYPGHLSLPGSIGGLGYGYPTYGYGLGGLGLGGIGLGNAALIESGPSMLGYPMGAITGIGGLGVGAKAPVGSTTVCESAPNVYGVGLNLPYGRPFL